MYDFPNWFTETVGFDGKRFFLIFDEGSTKTRKIRGTEVTDTRPFLFGRLPNDVKGKTVTVRGRRFFIDTIEKAGNDEHIYYLGQGMSAHAI